MLENVNKQVNKIWKWVASIDIIFNSLLRLKLTTIKISLVSSSRIYLLLFVVVFTSIRPMNITKCFFFFIVFMIAYMDRLKSTYHVYKDKRFCILNFFLKIFQVFFNHVNRQISLWQKLSLSTESLSTARFIERSSKT